MNPLAVVPKGPVYHDADDKKRLESRNGIIQAQYVFHCIEEWGPESILTPEILKEAQRLAVNQIYRCAGHFRDGEVRIANVAHDPPSHAKVPELVAEMCDYVNSSQNRLPVHLASYVMWRLNWIHPFFGGNGRTARSIAYLVLCAGLGFRLPGAKTIPELIVEDRSPYYDALREADRAYAAGRLDLSAMEELMSSLLAAQLVDLYTKATGRGSV